MGQTSGIAVLGRKETVQSVVQECVSLRYLQYALAEQVPHANGTSIYFKEQTGAECCEIIRGREQNMT